MDWVAMNTTAMFKPERVTKRTARQILVWIPRDLVGAMDRQCAVEDTDRSKLIRRATREYLAKFGQCVG